MGVSFVGFVHFVGGCQNQNLQNKKDKCYG